MASGPQAAIVLVDRLVENRALENYHLLQSVRGDLLIKLGRFEEARGELEAAAARTRNARERQMLLERAREADQKSARR
jgi:predicted RNA polymerase sigma factor